MAKKTVAKKKPNAPDLTLRNLHAEKKREAAIVKRLDDLEARNLKFGPRIQRVEEQVRELWDEVQTVKDQLQALLKREDERQTVTSVNTDRRIDDLLLDEPK